MSLVEVTVGLKGFGNDDCGVLVFAEKFRFISLVDSTEGLKTDLLVDSDVDLGVGNNLALCLLDSCDWKLSKLW